MAACPDHGGVSELSKPRSKLSRTLVVAAYVVLLWPLIAIASAIALFTMGPVIGYMLDPGFDGTTPLQNGYAFSGLKAYPRMIDAPGSTMLPTGNTGTHHDWTTEVGRIAQDRQYIVGEIRGYSSTASAPGAVTGWFIVDTTTHAVHQYADLKTWESELQAVGIAPATVQLEEYP